MLSFEKAEQFFFLLHLMQRNLTHECLDLCFHMPTCFSLLSCEPIRWRENCFLFQGPGMCSHPYFYLRRSAWTYCVTLFGVPSRLSRNRCLILCFLSWSIQYSRQMITLCYRYRAQNFSHNYCAIMELVRVPDLSLLRPI